MRSSLFTVAILVVGFVLAAVASGSGVRASQSAKKRPHAPLGAPALQSPRDDVTADSVPSFTWGAPRGAASYEFELSADGAFRSSVFGRGGSLATNNTAMTLATTLADGNYFWRVRALNAKGDAGPWSRTRTLHKSWTQTPRLAEPQADATISYPQPLVLSWSAVAHAFKYAVEVATDPALGSPVPAFAKPVETSGTDLAVPLALPPGRYYWAVTPLDSDRHKGLRSAAGSFVVAWPSGTATRVQDLSPDDRIYDPQFSWDSVPGAARYEVEINSSDDFAPGSKVCCSDPTTGTSLSPAKVLPNNTGDGGGYFWRMRAIDSDGNAGLWNRGPNFPKYFNPTTVASVPNLRVGDHSPEPLSGATPAVAYPVISWDPAPGAASYEVEVAPTVGATIATCNWAATGSEFWDVRTAATAWTPLSGGWGGSNPMGAVGRAVSYDLNKGLISGQRYCVRVRARGDRDAQNREVLSPWTELGDLSGGHPSFRYQPPAPPGSCNGQTAARDLDYLWPRGGAVTTRLPLFRWESVPDACSYYVVVARDEAFTDVIDIALTTEPVYAPRAGSVPKTYPDELSSYYWFVIPAGPGGNPATWVNPLAPSNFPQQFKKRSDPPVPISPTAGATTETQPAFRWSAAEGARDYHLQVAQDPSFGDPIDDVITDATAFTSSSTYPSDTVLYWRVRADDENKTALPWSGVETFRRQLPAPVPAPDNPHGGRTIPLLRWAPVDGAVSYDIHVDQPDGTQKDFSVRSAAFTPTAHYGTGVWTWKVRANFPKIPLGATPGAYSPSQPFTRFIGSPAGARGVANATRMLLSWDPVEMAKRYRVEVSKSNSFASTVETQTTASTSFAPKLTNSAYKDGGVLYWRVASVDEGGFLGGWTTGTFSLPKRIQVSLKGSLRQGMAKTVTLSVMDVRGRAIRKAKVKVSGGGLRIQAKRTTKRGTTAFRLRPQRRGTVTFVASKGGYRSGSVIVKVG